MNELPSKNPVILFEPDGYRMDGQKVMGRQSAGQGFLRAAVKAAGGAPLYGYTPRRASAQSWAQTVSEIDPKITAGWATPNRPDLLRRAGNLYVPGPGLTELARLRLRTSPDAWSITGITHTLASHAALDSLADLVTAPLMPWDALICTSSAALAVAHHVIGAQIEYLSWRLGTRISPAMPRLPVIPLGVHCSDFEAEPSQRAEARRALGLAEDEVVALFMGRLTFHAKAHPHAMYLGMQAAARATGKRLVLIQCGQFPNAGTEEAFRKGTAACPDVRCMFISGKDDKARGNCWAGADFFISLSDNIQETFGLTPVEAMAAGLPVVVTDWDGYKDTVRDGVDGFRIPTWLPESGRGEALAAGYETGEDTYDMFGGLACMNLSVDADALARALSIMVGDKAQRLRMGEAARKHAREHLDWGVIYGRYRSLWAELDELRAGAPVAIGAPKRAPARPDPFTAFASFPSHSIGPATRVFVRDGASLAAFESTKTHPLFSPMPKALPDTEFFRALQTRLAQGPATAGELAKLLHGDESTVIRWIAACAKMGFLKLEA